jgi:hypothetical protein
VVEKKNGKKKEMKRWCTWVVGEKKRKEKRNEEVVYLVGEKKKEGIYKEIERDDKNGKGRYFRSCEKNK